MKDKVLDEYKDKYASREVYNYELYDNNSNLIAIIKTVKRDNIIIRNNKCFLKIVDALIDKTFLDYLCKNVNFKGYIKAQSIFRDTEKGSDHKVLVHMPKVKLLSYVIKNCVGEFTEVNILFEAFKVDDTEDGAFIFNILEAEN